MSNWIEVNIQVTHEAVEAVSDILVSVGAHGVAIEDPQLMAEEKLALILGSEGDGLTDTTIASCDYTVKIPMYHDVDSLNVAAASAVAFWQLRKQ